LHKVALTGNIASGKSAVARVWKDAGARVVEADVLARKAVVPGSPGLQRIVERWGEAVLQPGGELDRGALRAVIFRDPEERKVLEAIVHPEVSRLRHEAYREAEAAGASLIVADIPLLFEVGLEGEFDSVVLVDAPEDLRLERLVRDRGLAPEEARRMMDSQWPSRPKRAAADFVIDNEGSLAALEDRAREVWAELSARIASDRVGR
jgi:dephospho-CoA kinase